MFSVLQYKLQIIAVFFLFDSLTNFESAIIRALSAYYIIEQLYYLVLLSRHLSSGT